MKILVTGHHGFIGTRLVQQLKKQGYDVTGYDIVDGDDTRDKFNLDKVMGEGQFDAVIHLAARAGVLKSIEYPSEYISTNIEGTANVISACEKHGCDNLIFFSSSSVLGGNSDSEKGLAECAPYNPISNYGVTKVTGEMLVKNSDLNWFIVRPFSVYGENGRKDMVVYKWIEKINSGKEIPFYGDGKSARGYTYVGDLVEGVCSLVKKMPDYSSESPEIARVFHLGGAEVITLDEMEKIFTKICEKKKIWCNFDRIPAQKEDISYSFANILKAGYVLKYNPKKRFKKVLTKILKESLCKMK